MREITVALDDDGLYAKVEAEASSSGRSVQEILVEALRQWIADSEIDEEEREEIDAAQREWKEKGDIEAHEFFDSLKKEEGAATS